MSENRNTTTKSDSLPNSNGNSNHLSTTIKRAPGSDDKKEQLENTTEKVLGNKVDNSTENDYTQEKSPTTADSTLTDSHRIPKPEFSFQDASSSAISDSNIQTNDVSTELDSVVMEIKQESSCGSPDVPQPSYAVSKIQVGPC